MIDWRGGALGSGVVAMDEGLAFSVDQSILPEVKILKLLFKYGLTQVGSRYLTTE